MGVPLTDAQREVVKEKILEALRVGCYMSTATKTVGITDNTVYVWRRNDPEFDKACEIAQSEGVKHYSSLLKKAAEAGNVQAIMFYLGRRSDEYKENGFDAKYSEALLRLAKYMVENSGLLPPRTSAIVENAPKSVSVEISPN